jgi:hypothetical protein
MIGPFLALCLTFSVASFLWRDNPLYRTAENLFVGVALGLFATFELRQVLVPRLWDRLAAGPSTTAPWMTALLIVVVCGLMLARPMRGLAWLGRVPIAVAVGSLAGMAAAGVVRSALIPQLGATAAPLVITDSLVHERGVCLLEASPANTLTNIMCSFGPYVNGLIILLGVAAGLVYLLYSRRESQAIRVVSRIGGLVLMATLGVTLGFLAMAHFAVTIGRAQTMIDTPGLALVALGLVVLSARYVTRSDAKIIQR